SPGPGTPAAPGRRRPRPAGTLAGMELGASRGLVRRRGREDAGKVATATLIVQREAVRAQTVTIYGARILTPCVGRRLIVTGYFGGMEPANLRKGLSRKLRAWRDERGNAAVVFALVVPVLVGGAALS